MTMENLGAVSVVICAVLTYITTVAKLENHKLRSRLRLALRDCLALYAIEENLCTLIGEEHKNSALAIKRANRIALRRMEQIDGPSELATPLQLKRELERL